MPLTDTAVKNLKPEDKQYTKADERGLSLLVTPAGRKLWRFRYYRPAGGRNVLSLGQYPETSLKQARERRDDARKQLGDGIDPGEARKEERAAKQAEAANTFGVVAEEWFEKTQTGLAPVTIRHVRDRLDRFILPCLGGKLVAEIGTADVLEVLRPIEAKNQLDTLNRVNREISRVLEYAIGTERRTTINPCPALRKGGIIKPNQITNQPAFTEPADVARLLRAIDSHAASPRTSVFVSAALKLLPLVFCRPGELIKMKWADVDLNDRQWRYLMTKKSRPVIVPLSRQAGEILCGLEQCRSGEYVFPSRSRTGRHMSDMTINRALQDMGFDTRKEHTAHGFRAMAKTMIKERLKRFSPEAVDFQLSHYSGDKLGYDRSRYVDERVEMMQAWADYLDELRQTATA